MALEATAWRTGSDVAQEALVAALTSRAGSALIGAREGA